MEIGDKILELRQKAKLTQQELAEKLNVTDKTVSRWETGRSLPDAEMLKRISVFFSVSISEIYDCIQLPEIGHEEKYNYNKIWIYKKYSIISYVFLIACFLLLTYANSTYVSRDWADKLLNVMLIYTAFALFIGAFAVQIVHFVSMYCYAKTKFYRKEYNKVMLKYGLMFCAILVAIAIIVLLVIISYA